MKKLRFRFITYFSVGLFLFLIYFFLLSLFLIGVAHIWDAQTIYDINISIEDFSGTLFLIVLFCFITGRILFSLFLVQPLSKIIHSIVAFSKGNYNETTEAFMNKGKLKWYYFLYKEVIDHISALGNVLQDNAIERNKIESAKNDWIAGVSHDLKTPLSYINGYSSLLLNENYIFDEDEIIAYLKEIYSKGLYIGKLIDDLNFTFSIDAVGNLQLKYSQMDMVSFMQSILVGAANEPTSEHYIFGFQAEMEQIDLVIDEGLMYRAIYNLLMNCVEHNPSGTKINVALRQVGEGVCIDIRDNGIGMNKETTEHIFDKYFSGGNRQKQGKGLGMFVAKKIIEAHQGSISISSTMGKGTLVKILLNDYE